MSTAMVWAVVIGLVMNTILVCGNLATTRALWEFYKSIKEHEDV